MEFRFCKHYSFGDKIFTNFEFDDDNMVTYHWLRTKELCWNEILHFRGASLQEILVDIGIPLDYLEFIEFAGNFNNVIFEKGSAIEFGLLDFSNPQVKDFIEGKTSELVLDIKEA